MEFAINYSHAAARLIRQGEIRVDRLKVPDWPDVIAQASALRPVCVHFAINAGADDSRTRDWNVADAIARQTNTPFVNMHLAPRAAQFGDEGNDANSAKVIAAMTADVRRACDFFGAERVIVENVPFGNPDEGFARAAVEPEAIARVIEQTGAGLLLDVSHARLTARALGIEERKYIARLPVRSLREIHFTGLQPWEGRIRDHMHFSDEDWIMAQWALDQIRDRRWGLPVIAALEYGGVGGTFEWRSTPEHIATQTPRLYEMVKRADPRLAPPCGISVI